MKEKITHIGIVESITASHVSVKILQTSACASCSAKGYCSSSETKEKLIDVARHSSDAYRIGEQVRIEGEASMGMQAILWAFVFPFLLVVSALFIFMYWTEQEVLSSFLSLVLLVPYYIFLHFNRKYLTRIFTFTIRKI